ncbi:uncharacterized protein LOC143275562 [Babylonia areolata]|uniref:uncharacterized protein LOC143275562 n=1 Tax=Babylonia areolata TaxID=304850 RepID=UPI003FD1A0F8
MAHPHLLFLLLLLFLTPTTIITAVNVVPVTAVEKGDTAEIECTTSDDGGNKKAPRWYRGDNATGVPPIPEIKDLRVFVDASTGKLTVKNATLEDSGTYLCQAFDQDDSATAELHVYEMPSYLEEGLIVMGISIALIVLVAVGLIVMAVQHRRRAAIAKAKLQQKMQRQLRLDATSH